MLRAQPAMLVLIDKGIGCKWRWPADQHELSDSSNTQVTINRISCYTTDLAIFAVFIAPMPSAPVVGWTNTDISNFRHSAYWRHWLPQLWSAYDRICVVPCTHNSFGNRSFSAADPCVWNALPSYLWQNMNYRHFKRALKGHMFRL